MPQDMQVIEPQEANGGRSLYSPAELLQDYLLHPHHVRDCEAVLADPDQVVSQRNIPLFLSGLHGDIETAESNTGQVFRLDLGEKKKKYDNDNKTIKKSTASRNLPCSWAPSGTEGETAHRYK